MSVLRDQFLALPAKKKKAILNFSQMYENEGFDCFLVGGSCRDLLLGKEPNDFDFATNCPLSITKKLFPKVIPTGESHGTLTVIFAGFHFEITRFRKDVSADGRRATITFADSIEEDQKRRDLRLNSLAYNALHDRIVDSQNAVQDFNEKIIRFVGHARNRILEDHLRALRYGRLILLLKPLGFRYQANEMKQVIQSFNPERLSVERLFDELTKILAIRPKDDRFLIDFLTNLQVFKRFGLKKDQAKKAIREVVDSNMLTPLWYIYFNEHGGSKTAEVMRLSREYKRLLMLLSDFAQKDLKNPVVIKEMFNRSNGINQTLLMRSVEHLLKIDIRGSVNAIKKANDPIYIKDLEINGEDLKGIDIKGKEIGITMDYLMRQVWRRPQLNRRELLLEMAGKYHDELH